MQPDNSNAALGFVPIRDIPYIVATFLHLWNYKKTLKKSVGRYALARVQLRTFVKAVKTYIFTRKKRKNTAIEILSSNNL